MNESKSFTTKLFLNRRVPIAVERDKVGGDERVGSDQVGVRFRGERANQIGEAAQEVPATHRHPVHAEKV